MEKCQGSCVDVANLLVNSQCEVLSEKKILVMSSANNQETQMGEGSKAIVFPSPVSEKITTIKCPLVYVARGKRIYKENSGQGLFQEIYEFSRALFMIILNGLQPPLNPSRDRPTPEVIFVKANFSPEIGGPKLLKKNTPRPKGRVGNWFFWFSKRTREHNKLPGKKNEVVLVKKEGGNIKNAAHGKYIDLLARKLSAVQEIYLVGTRKLSNLRSRLKHIRVLSKKGTYKYVNGVFQRKRKEEYAGITDTLSLEGVNGVRSVCESSSPPEPKEYEARRNEQRWSSSQISLNRRNSTSSITNSMPQHRSLSERINKGAIRFLSWKGHSSLNKKAPMLEVEKENIGSQTVNEDEAHSDPDEDQPDYGQNETVIGTDKYGFFCTHADECYPKKKKNNRRDRLVNILFHQKPDNERRKENTWEAVLKNWDIYKSRRKKLISLCRDGIPNRLRGKVWYAISNCDSVVKPGLFKDLVERSQDQSEHIPIFDVIEKDISRCYPRHTVFADKYGAGQSNLRKVLKAYALYCPRVGYCQGMGMLVGVMLMHLSPEDSFWLLVQTLNLHLYNYYTPGLVQFKTDTLVFDMLLKKYCKQVHKHFEEQGVVPIMYITKWFLTMYTTTLPWDAVLRVWDMFYAEGIKPLFRVGLAIIRMNDTYILDSCPTNDEILSFLLNVPKETLSPNTLIDKSLGIYMASKSLDKMRKAAQGTSDKTY